MLKRLEQDEFVRATRLLIPHINSTSKTPPLSDGALITIYNYMLEQEEHGEREMVFCAATIWQQFEEFESCKAALQQIMFPRVFDLFMDATIDPDACDDIAKAFFKNRGVTVLPIKGSERGVVIDHESYKEWLVPNRLVENDPKDPEDAKTESCDVSERGQSLDMFLGYLGDVTACQDKDEAVIETLNDLRAQLITAKSPMACVVTIGYSPIWQKFAVQSGTDGVMEEIPGFQTKVIDMHMIFKEGKKAIEDAVDRLKAPRKTATEEQKEQ